MLEGYFDEGKYGREERDHLSVGEFNIISGHNTCTVKLKDSPNSRKDLWKSRQS